ncbi:N-acetylglucosamine-6-phosphate deacetylase [Paenibacillus sp. J31TS4]|uniref:N-acetylglucosamine-6-phosphate deacetylase n=1 Tax=Paenibacillus sp. J31TS4 TaxID=2807195 RepID=UPI001B11E758|nr:N-acetylglucosamine-6-phosphate deacetylase [Paenibacillus sp. J31TS4]GIP36997.1 N-acetylglucosamine-6-phosphate deacetylase [Paenibacillus sp. J31TS4]
MTNYRIENVRAVYGDQVMEETTLWIRDGWIERLSDSLSAEAGSPDGDYTLLDGQGRLLIPGMIDVHIHGANGFDMMDGTEESIQQVSRTCAATGCTAFLATSVTSSLEDLLAMIRSVKRTVGREQGAAIAGLHLEGPYLNVRRKGMQNEAHLRHPDLEEMAVILREGGDLIKIVTIAPELPGGMELLAYLRERGIVVALAHSDATYEEAKQAFAQGASHVTHCFNGMRPIHHRDPGLVTAAFEEEHVSLQAIVDGVHLHPAIVRLMHRLKGPDRMVLITDALQAMGLGDGTYRFGGHDVTVADGVARLADGTLASSTVTMQEALRRTVELGIPLPDAVRMAATTPAELLGLHDRGRLAEGCRADLALLNDRYETEWAMVGGRLLEVPLIR